MRQEETITTTKEQYEKFLAQESEIEYLKYQLTELKRMIYGSKRERFVPEDPGQGVLFDLDEQ